MRSLAQFMNTGNVSAVHHKRGGSQCSKQQGGQDITIGHKYDINGLKH